jgi:alkylated DNA repair dioxygenase AlkB
LDGNKLQRERVASENCVDCVGRTVYLRIWVGYIRPTRFFYFLRCVKLIALYSSEHNLVENNRYSDTWQPILQSEKMNQVIAEISNAVSNVVLGSSSDVPALNSCNLNYYPTGGGVGFHADDEFLFDGQEQAVRIISLSLTAGSANNKGARRFQVRKKQLGEDGNTSDPNYTGHVQEIMLAHGDLMTMEGYFQKHYLHSVWPGDSKDYKDHPHTQGERINLTWRTIVKHLDGSDECRGKTCPLAAKSSKSQG